MCGAWRVRWGREPRAKMGEEREKALHAARDSRRRPASGARAATPSPARRSPSPSGTPPVGLLPCMCVERLVGWINSLDWLMRQSQLVLSQSRGTLRLTSLPGSSVLRRKMSQTMKRISAVSTTTWPGECCRCCDHRHNHRKVNMLINKPRSGPTDAACVHSAQPIPHTQRNAPQRGRSTTACSGPALPGPAP